MAAPAAGFDFDFNFDCRTRHDPPPGAAATFDSVEFFTEVLPAALAARPDLVARAAAHVRMRGFTVATPSGIWSLVRAGDGFCVVAGEADATLARMNLTDEVLADLVDDQTTPMAQLTAGRLDLPRGNLFGALDFWLVLRSVLDGVPVHLPGDIDFDGFDLHRQFRLDDPVAEQRAFLATAGYLHLRGVFDPAEMAEISAGFDAAAPGYTRGDDTSWWATTADGTDRLVRMQGIDERVDAIAALRDDPRLAAIGELCGLGHELGFGARTRWIEGLIKPVGVVDGISDVPWHKDCSLGRHSYECASMTVGISVTGADDESGQLRVIAGSHRALVWPALTDAASIGLPDVALPTETGDITIHLSCTLHMAQPPRTCERRVMYTGYRLPNVDAAAAAAGRARLRANREAAPVKVSQTPAV